MQKGNGHPAVKWVENHANTYSASNPNCIGPVTEMRLGKRCDGAAVEAIMLERNIRGYPPQTGLKMCPGPRPVPEQAQGRKHIERNGSSGYSLIPISNKGLPWEPKRRVLDSQGRPRADMQSCKADFFGLYGSKRSSVVPNQSNAKFLFPDYKDKSKTIDASPRSLGMMEEWEKKIVTTQGRSSNLRPHHEVFAIDKFRGGKGTGDTLWKTEALARQHEATGRGRPSATSARDGRAAATVTASHHAPRSTFTSTDPRDHRIAQLQAQISDMKMQGRGGGR